jgi:hypothetical protein
MDEENEIMDDIIDEEDTPQNISTTPILQITQEIIPEYKMVEIIDPSTGITAMADWTLIDFKLTIFLP